MMMNNRFLIAASFLTLICALSCSSSQSVDFSRDAGFGFDNSTVSIEVKNTFYGEAPFELKYVIQVIPNFWAPEGREYGDKIEVNFGNGWIDVTESAYKWLIEPTPDNWLSYTFEEPGTYQGKVLVTFWNYLTEIDNPVGRPVITVLPPEGEGGDGSE